MAFHNVFVLSAMMFLFLIFMSAQARTRDHKQLRPTRGFKDLELSTARSFGKRAVNMHMVNNILLEWIALESKLRELKAPRRTRLYEEDFLLE